MVFLGSSVSLISAVLTLVLILALGFIADFLYGRFSMMKNEWNKRFTQSLMVALLLMVFGFFYTELQAAEPEIRIGRSTLAEFKQTVKNHAEGDFAQKLKELSEKTSIGKNSGYWRLALKKQFDLSFDIGNEALHSGYYFLTDVNHSALKVIPVLGSKTEKILCLLIYGAETGISTLLVCQDQEQEILVAAEHSGGSL